jgi:hypothetical protein
MGITLCRKVGEKGLGGPPLSAAINASCKDDLSRMDMFDPTYPMQMG